LASQAYGEYVLVSVAISLREEKSSLQEISKLTEPLNKLIGYLKRNNLVKLYQNTTFDNRAKQSVSDSESEQ